MMHLRRSRREHFWIDDLYLPNNDRLDGADSQIRHRIAGRIGKEYNVTTDDNQLEREMTKRAWRLTFFDAYWVDEGSSRSIYQFAWNQQKVTLAQRKIELKSPNVTVPDYDLGDEILNFKFSDDEVSLLHARSELEHVTAADCDKIIEDINNYYTLLKEVGQSPS